jgi:hypothetical protein
MTPAQAIAAAKPGDVLTFASDEPIGAVKLGTKQAGVTVKGGVADSLTVYGAEHRFIGMKVRQAALGAAVKTGCVRVIAQDVVFDGLDAEGSRDTEGYPNGYGVLLDSRSSGVTLTASKVTGFWSCVVLDRNDKVTVDDCELGRSRRSPLLGVPGNGNRFSRLKVHTVTPKDYGGDGDHGNFIGFWTYGRDVEDVVLDTITCEQRDGWPVMGISMYCKGDKTGWWVRPTLRNIVIISQHTQGITLSQSRDATLDRLASFATRDPRGLPRPPKVQFAPMLFLKGDVGTVKRDVWMAIDQK